MILGILSLTCLGFGAVLAVPAVILGHLSKSSIRKSAGRLSGGGMATTGLILGYISIAFLPVMLAIVLPSLLHDRIAANESSAASTVRTINTAEVSYTTTYPNAGYARSLAVLGPGPSRSCTVGGTQDHACLIDSITGCDRSWCVRSGYRYRLTAACGENNNCTDYVVVAVPVIPGRTGRKSFCSTSDVVIRMKTGISDVSTPTIAECQSWSPVY
jgi:hypothetical protein